VGKKHSQESRTWWHGRDRNCEGEEESNDGDDIDTNVDRGRLDEMLTWLPELLFQCLEHGRRRRKAKKHARRDPNITSTSARGGVWEDDECEGGGTEAQPNRNEPEEASVGREGEKGGSWGVGSSASCLGGEVGPVPLGTTTLPVLGWSTHLVMGGRARNGGPGMGRNDGWGA
jgi:hypothetical protein